LISVAVTTLCRRFRALERAPRDEFSEQYEFSDRA
jgi:hypothetical protein